MSTIDKFFLAMFLASIGTTGLTMVVLVVIVGKLEDLTTRGTRSILAKGIAGLIASFIFFTLFFYCFI